MRRVPDVALVLIFTEAHVQHPVQLRLHLPVTTYRFGRPLRIGSRLGHLNRLLSPLHTRSLDAYQQVQRAPDCRDRREREPAKRRCLTPRAPSRRVDAGGGAESSPCLDSARRLGMKPVLVGLFRRSLGDVDLSSPRSVGSLRSRVEWGCAAHSKQMVVLCKTACEAPS